MCCSDKRGQEADLKAGGGGEASSYREPTDLLSLDITRNSSGHLKSLYCRLFAFMCGCSLMYQEVNDTVKWMGVRRSPLSSGYSITCHHLVTPFQPSPVNHCLLFQAAEFKLT